MRHRWTMTGLRQVIEDTNLDITVKRDTRGEGGYLLIWKISGQQDHVHQADTLLQCYHFIMGMMAYKRFVTDVMAQRMSF